jgi:hypothetical protein
MSEQDEPVLLHAETVGVWTVARLRRSAPGHRRRAGPAWHSRQRSAAHSISARAQQRPRHPVLVAPLGSSRRSSYPYQTLLKRTGAGPPTGDARNTDRGHESHRKCLPCSPARDPLRMPSSTGGAAGPAAAFLDGDEAVTLQRQNVPPEGRRSMTRSAARALIVIGACLARSCRVSVR